MKIIAFGHRQRVGKDTVTKFALSHIRTQYPGTAVCRCSMGDEIKAYAYKMFSWAGLMDRVYYDNNEEEVGRILPEISKTPRQIWIQLGKWGRETYPYLWNKLAISHATSDDVLIIPDIRSFADIEFFKQFPSYFVRIENPYVPPQTDGCDELLEAFKDWDEILVNDGDRRLLNTRACDLVDRAMEKMNVIMT